jgi:hypothetical protein
MYDFRQTKSACGGYSKINERACHHRGVYRIPDGRIMCAQHFRQGHYEPLNTVDEKIALRMASVLEG